jgi:hypothetical protein
MKRVRLEIVIILAEKMKCSKGNHTYDRNKNDDEENEISG